jgi:hypothetical protein
VANSIEVIAYSAGLMDGEGTIHIGGRGRDYGIQVVAVNTNYGVLEWLRAHWGGSIYELTGNVRSHHDWSRCWQWSLNNRADQQGFLIAVTPYLIIKRRAADLALAFLGLPRKTGRSLSADIIAQRRALAEQYRAWRAAGVDAPPAIEINDDQLAMELVR